MKMKTLLLQIAIIIIVSTAAGMVYNRFLEKPLPVLKTYNSDTAQESDEDLSVYFSEIDADGLQAMVDAGMAVLLDARTREHYAACRIPGAINLPIGEFSQDYDKVSPLLDEDKAIIIYCIGVHCIDSSLLAKELYQKGWRQIFVYKGGIEDWQQMGYPVEGSGGESHE